MGGCSPPRWVAPAHAQAAAWVRAGVGEQEAGAGELLHGGAPESQWLSKGHGSHVLKEAPASWQAQRSRCADAMLELALTLRLSWQSAAGTCAVQAPPGHQHHLEGGC